MDKDYVPFPGPKPFDYMWNPSARLRYDARCAAYIRYWKRRDAKIRTGLRQPVGPPHDKMPWQR